MITRAHIFFTGSVQGVGFRYTTQRLAVKLNVKGWVRNLPDGRVEVMAEGAKLQVEQLYEELDDHFEGYIQDKQITFLQADESFDDFRIIT